MNRNLSAGTLLVALAIVTSGCVSSQAMKSNASDIEASRYNTQAAAEYLRQGQAEQALEKIRKALEQDDENADAHMIYGMILARSNDEDELDDAEDAYEEAVSLRPEDPVIRNNYGSFLCDIGEHRDAIDQFERVASSRSYQRPEAALTNAGTCAARIPDNELAEEYLRRALSINREWPPALWQMSKLMLEEEKPLAARAFLQRLEAMGKLPAEALWLGVKIERRMNDAAAVARYEDILLRDYPESREAALVVESRGGGK